MSFYPEKTIEELEAWGHRTLADSLMVGHHFGVTVALVVERAFLFGVDEAKRSPSDDCPCQYDNIEDIKRDAVIAWVEALFSGKGLRASVNSTIATAVAFGFETAKKEGYDKS